jgi:nucleoid-associated protein YgaU
MLEKGAIGWAAAVGVVAALGVGGAVWHYRRSVPPEGAPAPLAEPAPAASNNSRQVAAATPAAPDARPIAEAPAPAQPAPAGSSPTPKQPQPSPEAELLRPQFDIVRIEPTGEAVIAGHSAPKAKVAVTDHGQVVAEADADESGQFVVLPPAFAPGAHALGLTARLGDGAPVASPGIVGVDVPQPSARPAPLPAIAAATPAPVGKPSPPPAPVSPAKEASTPLAKGSVQSASLQPPAAPARALAAPAVKTPVPPPAATTTPIKPAEPVVVAKGDASAPASPPPRIAITGVAADEAGRMVAAGAAPAGAFLRLYLNGSFLANVTAGADGLWSLTVEHGMKGGAYSIRADEIDRAKGSVISRAEVPFNYPEHIAELAAGAKHAAPAPVVATPPVATSPAVTAPATTTPAATTPAVSPPAASAVIAAPAQSPASAPQKIAAASPPTAAVAIAAPAQPFAAAPHKADAGQTPAVSPPASTAAVGAPAQSSTSEPPKAAAAQTLPSPEPVQPRLAKEAPASASAATVSPPATPSQQATAASAPPASSAHAIVRTIDTKRVVPGDSLWAISAHLYGNGLRYTQIYAANAGQIRNPSLIYPGQIFVLPQPTPY